MFFIIRALFWIAVVLFLLPASSAPKVALASSGFSLSAVPFASNMLALSGKPFAEAAAYCLRRPDQCREGMSTAQRFGERMDQGAKAVAALIAAPVDRAALTGSIVPIPPPRPAALSETAR